MFSRFVFCFGGLNRLLVALLAHGMGGKHKLDSAGPVFAHAVEHIHQSDHALGAIAGLHHIFHAQGISLPLVVAAIRCQQCAGADLTQLGSNVSVKCPLGAGCYGETTDNRLGEHALGHLLGGVSGIDMAQFVSQ